LIISSIGLCLYRCLRKRKKLKDANKLEPVVQGEREWLIDHGSGSYEYLGSNWRGITEKPKSDKHVSWSNVNSIN